MKSNRETVREVVARNSSGIVADLSEPFFDVVFSSDGVVKDIPVVGLFHKLIGSYQDISGAIFRRKVLRFIEEATPLKQTEADYFLARFGEDDGELHDLGERVLFALDKMIDPQKPVVLGRFFLARVRNEIDAAMFSRLCHSLNTVSMPLMPYLLQYYSEGQQGSLFLSDEVLHELSLSGLVGLQIEGAGAIGGAVEFCRTTVGQVFVKIGLA